MDRIIGKRKRDIFAEARAQQEQVAAMMAAAAAQLQEEQEEQDGEQEEQAVAAVAINAAPPRRLTRAAAAAASAGGGEEEEEEEEEEEKGQQQQQQAPQPEQQQRAVADGAGGPPTPVVVRTKRELASTPQQPTPGSASKRVRRLAFVMCNARQAATQILIPSHSCSYHHDNDGRYAARRARGRTSSCSPSSGRGPRSTSKTRWRCSRTSTGTTWPTPASSPRSGTGWRSRRWWIDE